MDDLERIIEARSRCDVYRAAKFDYDHKTPLQDGYMLYVVMMDAKRDMDRAIDFNRKMLRLV
jgi:hypothetical protein